MPKWVHHMIRGLKQMRSNIDGTWITWGDLFILPKWWSISIWCVVILIFLILSGCKEDTYIMGYNKDGKKSTEYFPLVDKNNRLHKFRKEYNIGIYDEDILYCVTHHKWVSVKGVYKGPIVDENSDSLSWTKTYEVRELKNNQW